MILNHFTKRMAVWVCSILLFLSLAFSQAPAAQAQSGVEDLSARSISAPITARPDNFPIYQLGDYAVMVLYTNPPQPNQNVYTWRFKDGRVERNRFLLGRTDSRGVFVNALFLQDPSVCGNYNGEQFSVGSPYNLRSKALRYIVLCN